jgi:hypothetical protein
MMWACAMYQNILEHCGKARLYAGAGKNNCSPLKKINHESCWACVFIIQHRQLINAVGSVLIQVRRGMHQFKKNGIVTLGAARKLLAFEDYDFMRQPVRSMNNAVNACFWNDCASLKWLRTSSLPLPGH